MTLAKCHVCGAEPRPPIKAKWCLVTPGNKLYRVGDVASERNRQVYLQSDTVPTREGTWVNSRVAHFERHYSNCRVITGGEILHYSVEKPDGFL